MLILKINISVEIFHEASSYINGNLVMEHERREIAVCLNVRNIPAHIDIGDVYALYPDQKCNSKSTEVALLINVDARSLHIMIYSNKLPP